MTSISGNYTASYSYNGLNTRVSKTEGGVTNTFRRDGVGVTSPVLADGSATYTPGISERRGSTTTYLHSGLKNAEAQTSTSQTITSERTYDAFGNIASTTGTWKGPFGYAGSHGYQEDGSGYKLLGHRLYDPQVGRFLTRDPIQDGRNWYAYCDNNPITGYDATGLIPINYNDLSWSTEVLQTNGTFRKVQWGNGGNDSSPGTQAGPGGMNPNQPPPGSKDPIDDNDEATNWDKVLSELLTAFLEEASHNPIPIGALGAPLETPFMPLEKTDQQVNGLLDEIFGEDPNGGEKLTYDSDPSAQTVPFWPRWVESQK